MKYWLSVFVFVSVSALCAEQEKSTLFIKLKIDDNQYKLVDSWLMNREFPSTKTQDKATEGSVSWNITSSVGEVLARGVIEDPQLLRAHLTAGNENKFSRQNFRTEASLVIIRVAYHEKMYQLNLERTPIIDLSVTKLAAKQKSPRAQKPLITSPNYFLLSPRKSL